MEKNKNADVSYKWEGINRSGDKVNGVIEARSITIAKAALRKQGIITSKVR